MNRTDRICNIYILHTHIYGPASPQELFLKQKLKFQNLGVVVQSMRLNVSIGFLYFGILKKYQGRNGFARESEGKQAKTEEHFSSMLCI